MLVVDPLSHLLSGVSAIALIVTLVYARPYAESRDILKGELFTLSLLVAAGRQRDGGGQQLPDHLPGSGADERCRCTR